MARAAAIGGPHGAARNFFCPHCGGWVVVRPTGLDDIVNARAALLDAAASYQASNETFDSEKPSSATIGADHDFASFPPPVRFPDLIAAFACRS